MRDFFSRGHLAQEVRSAWPCQIWSKSLKLLPRYGDFLFFQDGVPEDFGTKTDESTIDEAEEYLAQVLKKGTKFKKMDQLRNELYHHRKSVSLQQLPPTSSATRLHILRAVYATNEMVSLLSTTHDRLDPTQYGFEEVDDLLTPKMWLKFANANALFLCFSVYFSSHFRINLIIKCDIFP